MRETWVIAKREFLERVRTKWFVVMTILGPILMIGLFIVPALLASRGSDGAKVDIVDHSGVLGEPLIKAFAADKQHWIAKVVPNDTSEQALLDKIHTREISGFLEIPADALDNGEIVYRGDNETNQIVGITLERTIYQTVLSQRGAKANLTEAQVAELIKPPHITKLHTNGDTKGESGSATFVLGYLIAFILYMVITLYGINVMRSVVTEKTSRVVELMAAAAKPNAMMAGKILGVGGAGLAQIALWLIAGGIGLAYQASIFAALGIKGGGSLPSLDIGQLLVIAAFFVFGYLFYSSLYAAVGATVSSDQESQQAQIPITMFLVIGMVSMTAITGDPRGSTSATMTQVPMWSPMLMPLRYLLGGATGGEVAMSLGILAASTYVVSRAAAKIYRIGILMYGKRPSLGELLRWLRH
jgi:ABC-2 type transport system permease protein